MTKFNPSITHPLHLHVLHDGPEHRLVSEGRFGCDYAWNDDFTAYQCMPHRWIPGSDQSYIDNELDGRDDDNRDDERGYVELARGGISGFAENVRDGFVNEDDCPF